VLLLAQYLSSRSCWQVMAGSKKLQRCCMEFGRVLPLLLLLLQMLVPMQQLQQLQQLQLVCQGLGRSSWKLLR
jgi:hypothetical protein